MYRWLLVLPLIWLGFLPARADVADTPSQAFALTNGLRVIVYERHTSPLVAISLWVRAGAREERQDETGCAHFLEHTLFKGTTTRRAGDADIAIENIGAVLDAATGPDYAHFYTTVGTVHLTIALGVMADVIRNATLPAAEIDRERGVILDELAQHDADPAAHLIDLLYANAFPGQPYGRSPGGTQNAIRARTRETLLAFYRRCYLPTRCTLVLTGDCTLEQARREAERAFGDWQSTAVPQPITPQAPGRTASESHNTSDVSMPNAPIEVHTAARHSMVGIGFPAPAADDIPMVCAGMLIAAALGDARQGGRLAVPSLTDTEAVARYIPRRDPGLLILTARESDANRTVQTAGVKVLESKLMQAVHDLKANPPGRDELNYARRLVFGRLQFDTETNAGMARALGYADIVSGDTPDLVRTHLRKVTRADIVQYCQRFLNPEHATVVRLLPTTDITYLQPSPTLLLPTAFPFLDKARAKQRF